MGVSMFMEQEQADEVRCETKGPNNHDELRVGDFWRLEKALDGLERNGETQCEEEDSVHEGCENFSSVPAVGVSRVDFALVCHLDGIQRDNETHNIVEHVETVRDKRQ